MSTVISFAITDQDLRALEDASRREGVDLLKEASKLFALGLKANQLLEEGSATTGSSTGGDVVAAFELNGADKNAAAFQSLVTSKDFRSSFMKRVIDDQKRAQSLAR